MHLDILISSHLHQNAKLLKIYYNIDNQILLSNKILSLIHIWWFHAKNTPGSHVVVRTNGEELPDRTFEEAGKLAAYYSKARGGEKVEIDYIEKKHVKKPKGAKPGFVVYYTNYSLIIDSDISHLKEFSD